MSHDGTAAQRLADRALDAALQYHRHTARGMRTTHDHLVAAALAAQLATAEEARLNSGTLPPTAYACCLGNLNHARARHNQHTRIADVFGQVETICDGVEW